MNTSTVSVIIPARNEEARITACLASLLAQETPPLEILVVDDASTDRTAAVVEAIRQRAPSLRLIRNRTLPPGWIGKSHALHVGTAAARGSASGGWLLFVDADVTLAPHAVRETLARAEADGVALLSLSPEQTCVTWWEQIVQPVVFTFLARRFRRVEVNDPAAPAAAANGQFLLIRRDAYFDLGGHEAIRGEMLEDVALARLAKAHGYRIALHPGFGLARARMYTSLRHLVEGWGKNLYLLTGSTALSALKSGLWVAGFYWSPLALFLAGLLLSAQGFKGGAAVAGIGLVWIILHNINNMRKYAFFSIPKWKVPLLTPLGALAFQGLLLYSAWLARFRSAFIWKERTYSVPKD
ncbi:MAG: glycosyltransferase [Nitrospirae bacterium]|nr:glycosyltransferase [Nitrospirota bacterium]